MSATEISDKISRSQYFCDYCRAEITKTLRIKCAECKDFDLCLSCFANGVELLNHKRTHKYRIIEHVTTPLFDLEWGADEELLLLEGVSLFGFGNWSEIANHVGTKSKGKCETHYNQVYLQSKTAPLPDPSLKLSSTKPKIDEEHQKADLKQKSVSANQVTSEAALNRRKTEGMASVVGYQPLREDFEVEYDNEFEKIIADMEFSNEDTEQERSLKLKVLELYNRTLDAREERRKFIIDRGLLYSKDKRKLTGEEKEIVKSFDPFARFHTREEHDEFIDGILNEHRLRRNIERLQEQRSVGVKTLAEGDFYEQEKSKKSVYQNLLRSKSSANRKSSLGSNVKSYESRRRGFKSKRASIEQAQLVLESTQEPGEFQVDSSMEGFHQLDDTERLACAHLQLYPKQFLALRDHVVKESAARGLLDSNTSPALLKVDINRTKKIFDFYVSKGWDSLPEFTSNKLD